MIPSRFLATLCALALCQTASAQPFLQPTTVQLPTFSSFTVSTTVSVPDSGGAYVGGYTQMSNGWTAFGPAWGGGTYCYGEADFVSGWTASAHVIDLPAMDAAILASAPPDLAPPVDPFTRQLKVARASSAGHVPGSVAEARRARAEELAQDDAELEDLIAQAESHLAKGKANLARIYLQMAAGKARGERKRELEARAATLKRRPSR